MNHPALLKWAAVVLAALTIAAIAGLVLVLPAPDQRATATQPAAATVAQPVAPVTTRCAR